MKILNTQDFVLEKMKIIPISNAELDNYDSFKLIMHKIKKPKYEDILVSGNVVYTNESINNIYICYGKYKKNGIVYLSAQNDYIMVCRSWNIVHSHYKYQYLYCDNYFQEFPKHSINENYNIKSIYRTNIDLSKIKSKEEFSDLFDKIDKNAQC